MRPRRDGKLMIAIAAFILSLLSAPALAEPYLVLDVGSGRVLEQEDAFKRWYPASLTKLMTAYVAFRAVKAGEIQLNSPVRVSQNAAKEPPAKMGYPPGSVLTLDNALKIIMVKSANDIATAIAESVSGSVRFFAARMNAEAQRLGMTDTHFVNAHGLHSTDNYTTARDLALLVRAIRTEFPQYAGYFSIEAIGDGKTTLRNVNLLIGRFDGIDGMKTGFVCASGFNLVATATRGGRLLAAIVLGTHSQVERAEKAAELLARGFQTAGATAPMLASLRPSSPVETAAVNMRSQICSAEAVAKRVEKRDDEGELIIESDYVQPMEREPRVVAIGLGGADGPASSAVYADVPLPTPRPEYPPRQVTVGEGG